VRSPLFTILNQVAESMSFAVEALRANKVRTFLSTMGITIGIFCIIMVLTMVDSLEKNVQSSVESLGKNVVFVEKWPWEFSESYPWWKYMNRPSPKLGELSIIRERSALAEAVALVVRMGNTTLKYGSNSAEGVMVNAVSHDYYRVQNVDLSQGRYFTETESAAGAYVAIIGNVLAETLFPNLDPVGKEITLKGTAFRVIGIIKKQGESILGNSMDNIMLLPAKTVANYVRINSDRTESSIQVKAFPDVPLQLLEEELRGIMRSTRKLRPAEEQNFALNKTTLIEAPLKAVFGVITFAGWIIGGFAMLVGGFGIANIMFVSVKERTNQIGIQKSLGAKNYFILIEFLVEAILLCLVGGATGILLVWLISYGVSSGMGFSITLGPGNIITGVSVSVVIGLLSGFIPAYTASRLDPVAAIRAK
jgi:putative ABC transport system permease protein